MRVRTLVALAVVTTGAVTALAVGCENKHEANQQQQGGGSGNLGASASLAELMKARNLSEADVEAALKTYVPTGKMDEYYIFASGGQSGNVDVIGVPSMRLLKVIGVFTPESWQGWGFGGDSDKILDQGNQGPHKIRWADMHHPNLSETKGDYDGEYLFVNDKANARVAVVDLKDFQTKQMVANPLAASDHGGAFVTPNTEYVIETSQYPAPLGREYAPLGQFKEKYRGVAIFWKFDRQKGRIDKEKSWALELPPYTQDLADAGKLDSDGWAYINSFNSEMAVGGTLEGKPPIESGASQNDMDYLHVINWKKAEELVNGGKAKTIAGMRVLTMDVSGAEGVLTLVGEPKSPHGCDVTPDGKHVVVGGKLDTHTTIYDAAKMKQLIEQKKFEGKDGFGLPIMAFKEAIAGQVEIGLGPLHTVFDDKGNAYTSVFIESVVAKWSYKDYKKPVEKLKVQYNIGHILAAEGDTVSPDGKYVVAMNKMSMDRFLPVGPLYPQNFQLVGIDGEKMRLLADMPLPNAEPHYSQMIKADKIKPLKVYKVGTNALGEADPTRVEGGKERVVRNGNKVEVFMTAIRSHFTPDQVEVEEGDEVTIHLTSLETAEDQTHGFTIDMYNINVSLEPGKHENITFKADMPGTYPMYCTEFCSALHLEMTGYFLVKPKKR
ncbi:MAG: Sec-dependent nitrous-oxide reductase [Myxococcales bacterium]|nr:Sec-dependent nitrous-oxide reductase [Myxococcales bacterium]